MSEPTNPTITGLQNMVANDPRLAGSTNPATKWASYDQMSIIERQRLVNEVHDAKRYPNISFNYNVWENVLTDEFLVAIREEIDLDKAEKARLAAEAIEADRIRINDQWDRRQANGSRWVNEQPTDNWGETIGTRAYKWLRNFKSNNGNWYAEYQPVRGGDNRKYFSLSFNKWQDDYQTRVVCDNGHSFYTMTPLDNTTCPHCGSTQMTYRGRY